MKKMFYYGIASGSKGNSGLYVADDTCILIDMGISYRKLTEAMRRIDMQPSDIDAVLLTHEHSDHIKGLPQLFKRNRTRFFASAGTRREVIRKHPDLAEAFVCFDDTYRMHVGDTYISAFETPHDAEHCLGFILETDAHRFGYATDLGFIPTEVMQMLSGCESVVLESNHDPNMLQVGPYPYILKQRIAGASGHLSNPDCAAGAVKLAQTGTKNFILSHLSETNNMPELALQQTKLALRAFPDCRVYVAPVFHMDEPIYFDTEAFTCSQLESFA